MNVKTNVWIDGNGKFVVTVKVFGGYEIKEELKKKGFKFSTTKETCWYKNVVVREATEDEEDAYWEKDKLPSDVMEIEENLKNV